MIVTVIASNLAVWRDKASSSQLSLPALQDFEWRIDIKAASDKAARMSIPTALVQMKIDGIPSNTDELAPRRIVNFEVTKDTLATMLDGMGKILAQLDSVATSTEIGTD